MITLEKEYTPSRNDIDAAYQRRCRPGEEVDFEQMLEWIEQDMKRRGLRLAPDWQSVCMRLMCR